ncbi:thermonuclease family protein [Ramlibacter sp. AW1]|uniref:Thermonuclease family protein n=1 Tax=Ramlibacter aurantiacus TaxID=2801330 RepID=A0A937D556_9BURK|nr:thermonuclease family protein [Ramlibacter aurantiacus]MBL0422390.1 thermonuclease family protein [Ramlibacter aurantiacus]
MTKKAWLLAFLLSSAAYGEPCLVVGLADGDTVTARCGPPGAYRQVKVRLAEIDAPEKKQPFGHRSRQALADLCFRRSARLRVVTSDRYGRAVARVECGGVDANAEMVRRGMAWAYTKYQTDSRLTQLEAQARARGAGLWADRSPQPPWEWRQKARRR